MLKKNIFATETKNENKNMKKIIVSFLLVSLAMTMSAQNEKGQFSVKPMAGVNLSTLAGSDDFYKYRADFSAGAELEYGVSPILGISLGAMYSQQGAKFDGQLNKSIISQTGEISIDVSWVTGKLTSSYVYLPLMANFYIPAFKYFSFRIGAQIGFNLNNEMNLELLNHKETTNDQSSHSLDNIYPFIDYTSTLTSKEVCKTMDFGIPVGLTYEYMNYSLNIQYYFGLADVCKYPDLSTFHNRCLSVTLGYRFQL